MIPIHPAIHRHVLRNYLLHALVGLVIVVFGTVWLWSSMQAAGAVLFNDPFGYSAGLITNEYAYWNAGDPSSRANSNWDMTSGSLFEQNGAAWSGVPDDTEPDAASSNGTDSAVFRLNTKRFDFGDVQVNFRLFQNGLSSTASTPAVAWDGIHIFLRYQSEYNLYYASVNRRDGAVVIKKKCPGGPSNGGTYYELGPGEVGGHPIPFGSWQNVGAQVQNNADGSVTIRLLREGQEVIQATDTGVGCAVIRSAGATGIRGDNDNFLFDDFTVTSLSGVSIPSPTPTPAPAKSVKHSATPTAKPTAAPTSTSEPTGHGGTHKTLADATGTPTPKPAPAKPNPLSTGALMLAARTQPNFWAGILALVLGGLLAYAGIRRHLRPQPPVRPSRPSKPPKRR